MEDGDNNGTPPEPKVMSFRRFQQLRGIRSKVDQMLRSCWQQRINECAPLAEAAVERALERYAKNGPSR
jgi:hypothetical protein